MSKSSLYVYIWITLVTFTILEILALLTPFTQTIILMSIVTLASIKAILIALFYQHLKYEQKSLSVFPLAFIILLIIFVLSVIAGGHY